MYLFKRPVRNFRMRIDFCLLHTQERNTHLQLHHFVILRKAQQGTCLFCRVILRLCLRNTVSFPGKRLHKRTVCLRIEIYRISLSVVPSATNTCITSNFMVGKHLNFRTDKLLSLACIRHWIFSQEETCIHCQRFQRIFRIRKTIERSAIGSSDFRTDTILLELRIIIS